MGVSRCLASLVLVPLASKILKRARRWHSAHSEAAPWLEDPEEDAGSRQTRIFLQEYKQDCSRPERPRAQDGRPALLEVHVAYGADSGGRHAVGALSSMLSLGRSLADPGRCTIHLIVPRAGMTWARGLVECFYRELAALPATPRLQLHEMRPLPLNISRLKASHHQPGEDYARLYASLEGEAFARLYLHEYLPPNASRVLWLDTDTIVRSDVGPLYRMRMEHTIAAVQDGRMWSLVSVRNGSLAGHVKDMFSPRLGSGVLLIDLDRWRAEKASKAVEVWIKRTGGAQGEQAALAMHFQGRFDVLDWRWNVAHLGFYWKPIEPECIRDGRILHWSGQHKPWRAFGQGANDGLYELPKMACAAVGL